MSLLTLAEPTLGGAQALTIGVNVHPEQPIVNWTGTYDPAQYSKVLDQMQAAGVQMVRLSVPWVWIEPTGKGQYDQNYLATVDAYVNAVRAHGMKLLILSSGSPCWATSYPTPNCVNGAYGSDWTGGPYLPRNLQDAADNAVFIVKRWAPDAYEIWNEPNDSDYLKVLPGQDPALEYTDLVKAIYPSVKAASPQTTVIAGALSMSDTNFLQAMYNDGVGPYEDAISIHPYNLQYSAPFLRWGDPTSPFANDPKDSTATGVPAIHSLMVGNGDGTKPLWLDEFGFSACNPSYLCLDEQTQAAYLKETLDMIRNWPYVTVALVHDSWDSSANMNSWNGYGMLRNDFTRRPAYCVLAIETGAMSTCSSDAMSQERTAQDSLTRAWILSRKYYLAHSSSFRGFGAAQLHAADASFTGYALNSYNEPTSANANPKLVGITVNNTGSQIELCNAASSYAYCVREQTGASARIQYGKATGNVKNAMSATNSSASTTW